jgi:hypothetical protein
MTKVILKRDSHLIPYQLAFGATTTFSPSLFVGGDTISDVEPVGSVLCTCFTADKIKSGETGKKYDHQWLWTQMVTAGKTSSGGASPKDAFAMAVKGQRVIPTGEIETSAGYFQVEIGQYDFFTNVKSAIQLEYNKGFKRPVGIGSQWYSEWENVTVLPLGKTHVSDHEWQIVGWDESHPNCLQIDSHEGYYKWIPQDVFNAAMDATYGSVALTIAETSQEQIDFLKTVKVSLWDKAFDVLYNIIKQLSIHTQSMPQPNPQPVVNQPEISSQPAPKYLWDTKDNIRHSIRLICDEQGLSLMQKDMLCDICQCESAYNIHAQLVNSPTSIDRGLFQINGHYHPEATEANAFNPEWNTRWAVAVVKSGRNDWPASKFCWNKGGKYDSIL